MKPIIPKEKFNSFSNVKNVIAVMSGKGGVGKSSVTSLLAVYLQKQGFKVGVLDADITGPSIPKVFGLDKKAFASENGIHPVQTSKGIKVMSINLLLDQEDAPVVWRGPILSNTMKQFYTDVIWEDLDYLLIDLPPGTGDVPLTAMQSFNLKGLVVVTSPQEVVNLIVQKSINMAKSMNINILGVLENLSYLKCPDCDKEIKIFGNGVKEEYLNEKGIKLLGRLPIDPEFASLCDDGKVELYPDINFSLEAKMNEILKSL
ncbi:Mrp/NBP35 family ATP-binding protein [Peptostreptococcaceae bacterium AGR-M142]